MEPAEKALDLLCKINGQPITLEDWRKVSNYARSELKRKVNIVIDEILQTNPTIKGTSADLLTQIVQTKAYWYRVQDALNAF